MGTIRVPGEADPSAMQLQQMRKLYLFFPRGRPNAIIFTGAIGETEPAIRAAACEVFDFLGLQIDPEANAASRVDSDIATINSSIRVFVIKAEENWQIARECAELLRQP
jgi:acetate kinase